MTINKRVLYLALIFMISIQQCITINPSKCTATYISNNNIIKNTYKSSTSPTSQLFVNVVVGSSGDEYYFVQNTTPNSIYITRRDTSFTLKWENSFDLTMSANSPCDKPVKIRYKAISSIITACLVLLSIC